MFKPVPSQPDFVAQEHEILAMWEQIGVFEKLVELRSDAPRWSFIDGPITANNPMGVHHGWGRTYKDLFQRFKAMQGFKLRYQNGFDCQGLWVEVNVERALGFKSKRDIESYGLANFVNICKQQVLHFAAVQTNQSIRMGHWMDWNNPDVLELLSERMGEDPGQTMTLDGPRGPVTSTVEDLVGRLGLPELGGSYFTFSNVNNYTIWEVLKSCHDRGWIYKGRDVMPWCPRCGTGISQHEIVTEGYQELTHASVTLRLPLVDQKGASLLVWTTTPWTLTSNVAAAVGPELTYVEVAQNGESYYLSKGTLPILAEDYEVVRELQGSEMEGWRYRGPFDDLPAAEQAGVSEAHRVILWEEVGEEEGTGVVHIAPGAGAEDFALSKENDLPVVAPLNEAGHFVEGFSWLTGLGVEDVPQLIFDDLEKKGLLYKVEDYTHRYPICWRCDTELVFRLVDEWFISMGEQLDKPYEEVNEVEKQVNLRYQIMEVVRQETQWYPAFGKERELDWLRNMHDWMISKKRYWGLALPIWECSECGHFEVIGSKEELKERALNGWEAFEGHTPHRPYVDAVTIACPQCGAEVHRIKDVGNPWLDAGIVAMSTLRYNSDREYWERWYPADLITESFPGQFRNWFYSLLAMSTILERRAPFEHCFTYATLLAEDGRAMHKSWGNMIEFNEAADHMGVDVMRWMYSDHKPERDLLFGYHRADEVRRQFLLPLWNVYAFFVTYANLDRWTPRKIVRSDLTPLDGWILAELQRVIVRVTEYLETYQPDQATTVLNQFVDRLSNWYLRRSRRRFWAKSGESAASDQEKAAAYATLYHVLEVLIRLLAPFTPFVTEVMYQNLVRAHDEDALDSVHHDLWPDVREDLEDDDLRRSMDLVMALASLGHAARNQAGVKLRQPLSEAAFSVGSAAEREVVKAHSDLLADELNVKQVRLLDAASEVVSYRLHPLPKQLGQKHGSDFPAIREKLLELDPEPAAMELQAGRSLTIELNGKPLEINPDEVEVRVEPRSGFAVAAEGSNVAALDTGISEELRAEGLAREFVRHVQELRKAAGFEVDDRITIAVQSSDAMRAAVREHQEYIQSETLADGLEFSADPQGEASVEAELNGEQATIAVRR